MIPITIGPVYLPIGIANTFAVWGDGNTDNPRTVSISQDTVLTPTYRTSIQTSLYEVTIGTIAFFLLPLIALHHKRKRTQSQKTDGSRASATEVSEEDSAQSEIPSPRRETL